MTITPAAYRPFQFTRQVQAYGKKAFQMSTPNLTETAKKVGRSVLAILAFLSALLADLAMIPIAWLYNRYWGSETSFPQPALALAELTDTEVDQILAAPFAGPPSALKMIRAAIPGNGNIRVAYDGVEIGVAHNTTFLKTAITRALQHNHDERIKGALLQLIQNDGAAEQGAAFVDIFHWVGKAHLALLLITQDRNDFYPLAGNPNECTETLVAWFNNLPNRREKAKVILELTVPDIPDIRRALSPEARLLVQELNTRAFCLTQEQGFIALYRNATREHR